MDFTATKSDLLRILARAASVAQEKGAMAYMSMLHLEAHADGKVSARATDNYLGVDTFTQGKVKEPGSVCVKARRAYSIVREMPTGEIRLRILKTHIEVASGKSKIKLDFVSAEDFFPVLPRMPAGYATASVTGAELARCFTQGSYAMLEDDSRPDQHASLIEAQGGTIRVVSAQSKYFAWADGKAEGEVPNMLVPFRGVGELKHLAENAGDELVHFAPYEGVAFFASGDVLMSCKLVDAPFVPYRKIVPEKNKMDVVVSREALLAAVKRTILVIDKSAGGTLLTFAEGQLLVSTENEGECEDLIDCDATGNMAIVVNSKCFKQVLDAVRDDDVRMGLNGALGQIYVQSDECKAILAPIKPRGAA